MNKGKGKFRGKRKPFIRRMTDRFLIPQGTNIDYKNLALLQRFVNDRGKIASRRLSGVTAKQQRQLVTAIKRARFLALLTTGGVKK